MKVRFLRFSLRTLLLAMLALAIAFSIVAPVVNYHRAIAIIEQHGGSVVSGDSSSHGFWRFESVDVAFVNSAIDEDVMNQVAKLPEVNRLFISNTRGMITNWNHLSRLGRVRHLEVVNGDDTVFHAIRGIKTLKTVKVSGNLVTGKGTSLLREMPSLAILDLSYTRVEDEAMREIGTLLQLKELNVTGTNISDIGISNLCHLKQLIRLSFSSERITSSCFPYLNCLSSLEELRIHSKHLYYDNTEDFLGLDNLVLRSLEVPCVVTDTEGRPEISRFFRDCEVISRFRVPRNSAQDFFESWDAENPFLGWPGNDD